jgi:hypothetical protein
MTHVCVASTIAAYKGQDRGMGDQTQSWLKHIDRWRADTDVTVFAALQTGQGHDNLFAPLRRKLHLLDATTWTFAIDDGTTSITTESRLIGICTGRNLCHEFVLRNRDITHLLLLDSDVEPDSTALAKLLQVEHPVVGGRVPTYDAVCRGPRLLVRRGRTNWNIYYQRVSDKTLAYTYTQPPFPEDAEVREHWNTAGFLLLRRDVVLDVRWGWNLDDGCTDDPWFARRVEEAGYGKTWVRHDVIGLHQPDSIIRVEHRGHDLSIVR